MAREIDTQQTSLAGAALYATLDGAGGRWNGAGYEAVSAANWASYAVPLAEAAGTGYFAADRPAGIPAGTPLSVAIYRRTGSSPATSDPVVGAGRIGDASASAARVWDEPMSGHAVPGSYGAALGGDYAAGAAATARQALAGDFWGYSSRTLTSAPGPSASDIAGAVWSASGRTLTAFAFSVDVGTFGGVSGSVAKFLADYADGAQAAARAALSQDIWDYTARTLTAGGGGSGGSVDVGSIGGDADAPAKLLAILDATALSDDVKAEIRAQVAEVLADGVTLASDGLDGVTLPAVTNAASPDVAQALARLHHAGYREVVYDLVAGTVTYKLNGAAVLTQPLTTVGNLRTQGVAQ